MSQDSSSSSSKPGKASPPKVDPEVKAKPERRQFSAEYKRRILEEADACTEPSQIGALLRREGLYSSNLTHWRQQMSKGALKALSPKKRGPKPDPLANENAALRRRIERLEAELKRAETIIEVQKNSSNLRTNHSPFGYSVAASYAVLSITASERRFSSLDHTIHSQLPTALRLAVAVSASRLDCHPER